MNKKGYKRIIGLFIFTITFALLSIIPVYANECDNVKKDVIDNNEKLLLRYGLSMDFNDETNEYMINSDFDASSVAKITAFSGFDASKVKFKIVGMYFYEPYPYKSDDEGKLIKEDKTDADLIKAVDANYVVDVSGSLEEVLGTTSLSNGKPIKFDWSKAFAHRAEKDANKPGIAFKLEPDGFNDPEIAAACNGKVSFSVILYLAYEKAEEETPTEVFEITDTDSGTTTNWVDCNKNYTKGSFEYNFCADKIASVGPNGDQKKAGVRKFTIREYKKGNMIKYEDNSDSKKIGASDSLPFKCDYNKFNKDKNSNSSDVNYYVNKSYLYGSGTIRINLEGGYQYSGEYDGKDLTLNASCELKCEEVVKVEYGPPVASKAGLCFEYKVKVTSRVNCEMKTPPTKPPKQVVCTPTPSCKHNGGKVWPIGGPNEDFDECVASCDGGVYSDKCVNKCYKQVYGTSISRKTTGSEIAYSADLHNIPYIYKLNGDGKIIWDTNGSSTRKKNKTAGGTNSGWDRLVKSDSYWHKHHRWGLYSSIYNLYDKGIPVKLGCDKINCKWKTNTKGKCGEAGYAKYYNHPDVYKKENRADGKDYSYATLGDKTYDLYTKDKEFNKKQYEKLTEQCKAYAACNTTTAEFTISVDYTEKGENKTKQTINFPYTENNDKNSKDTITHNNDSNSITCPTDSNSIILDSAGCYECGLAGNPDIERESENGKKKMYMTEWSFPGTWINNKTGKISYNPVKSVYWKKIKEKFCLPLNVANVNTKWYNYYQFTVNGDENYSYNDTNYIRNVTCPDGSKLTNVCTNNNSTFTDEDKIEYNINATARKFGMYEWNIDVSCFYATNDIYPKVKESDNCSMLTCIPDEKYRIRSVDLGNLFPDTSSESESRTPGFNWSSYANQTKKDTSYISAPSNYAKWIQTRGVDSTYSDENLDYEINLSKEDISKIKKQFNSNYTKWNGDIPEEIVSVVNYQSKLIRNELKSAKYPDENTLKCNNIGSHTPGVNYSANCEDFSDKEGK